jgi:tetratricopeptide (TPR) repeat protein
MKSFLILMLLVPIVSYAQNGERFLTSFQSMLATNRTVQISFFPPTKRETFGLDTLSSTPQNYHRRAMYYLWQHDYEQATGWLEKAAALYPKEHGFVGETYLNQLHDYDRALQHLSAYDASTPTFDDIIHNNPVSYLLGLAHRNLGDYSKAVQLFCIGIDSLSIRHGAEWVNYRHFVSRAVSYIALQQPEKALRDLDSALKNFNRSALVQYHRGRALLQLNRKAEARTAFQDASFFFKALRAERTGDYQEDDFNPLYEPEIDEALSNLKP